MGGLHANFHLSLPPFPGGVVAACTVVKEECGKNSTEFPTAWGKKLVASFISNI